MDQRRASAWTPERAACDLARAELLLTYEPDDAKIAARSDMMYLRKHGVGLVLASGSTAPNPPLRFKHRSVDLTHE